MLMRLRHVPVTAMLCLAVLLACAVPALAASTLNAIAVAMQPTGGARLTVQFSGPPPRYTMTGGGARETSVIFQQATLGPSVPPTIAGTGPIRSISVAQVGGNVAVSLHLA